MEEQKLLLSLADFRRDCSEESSVSSASKPTLDMFCPDLSRPGFLRIVNYSKGFAFFIKVNPFKYLNCALDFFRNG